MRIALILALTLFAGGLCAQYVRTSGSSSYVERAGFGVNARWLLSQSFDDNCRVVNLPFAFRYFDRSYNTVNFSTNGRLSFSNATASVFDSLAITATAPVSMRDCIHAISADLYADYRENLGVMCVYFEADRAVFQWREVSLLTSSGYQRIGFQVHLLQNHTIEFHFDQEASPFADPETFVSGLVNSDGTQVVAGFGNMLTQQTAFPFIDSEVVFTPTFTAANGLNLHSRDPYTLGRVLGVQNNLVLQSFRVTPYGTGGTITQIQFGARALTNVAATYDLVVDTAPIGQYNGETPLGSVMHVGTTVTVSTLSESIVGAPRDFLIVANITAIPNPDAELVTLAATGVTATSPVWGGNLGQIVFYTNGSAASALFSNGSTGLAPVNAGASNAVVGSFEVRANDAAFPAIVLNALDFQFTHSGAISDGAFSALRLWRDNGRIGVLDSVDQLLATDLALSAGLAAFGPFGPVSADENGVDFLITADITGGFAGSGSTLCALAAFSSSQANDNLVSIGTSLPLAILGTGAATYIRWNNANRIDNWPVQPGDVDLAGVAFTVQTSAGAGSIPALTFTNSGTGLLTGVTNARLLLDNGTTLGRVDAGDTALTATISPSGSSLVCSAIAGLTTGIAPANVLFAFDLTAGAAGSYRFALSAQTASPATVFKLPATLEGATHNVGTGAAASGIDLAIGAVDGSQATFGGTQFVRVCQVTATARGMGGVLPALEFDLTDPAGGIGTGAGLELRIVADVGTDAGILDLTDVHNAHRFGLANGTLARNSLALNSGSMSFLVYVQLNRQAPRDGVGTLTLRGVSGGTNVRIIGGVATFAAKKLDVRNGVVIIDGGANDGGCSTQAGNRTGNALMLLALAGTLAVALRSKRRTA